MLHEAVKTFAWMFLDSFDAFKSEPRQAASKGREIFRNDSFTMEECWEGKKKVYLLIPGQM